MARPRPQPPTAPELLAAQQMAVRLLTDAAAFALACQRAPLALISSAQRATALRAHRAACAAYDAFFPSSRSSK